MCGIAGFIDFNKFATSAYRSTDYLSLMGNKLYSRGPDNLGFYFDNRHYVGFVHARLSIQDLSSAGNQPMVSNSGRYIIIFNGEIYNHLKIRDELSVFNNLWHGSSDTETLLFAIDIWGVQLTLSKLIGMFAFALYDRDEKTVVLARDRFGEKPLYYSRINSFGCNFFIFASDLFSLKSFPFFSDEIDRTSLGSLIQYNFISSPNTIYKNSFQLSPGTFATINISDGNISFNKYWDSKFEIQNAVNSPFKGSIYEAEDFLDELLSICISEQLISDVPLGVLLSGGIDSSIITAIAQYHSPKPLNTFSIGFEFDEFNEATRAKNIAKHLGTNHTELIIRDQEAIDAVIKMPYIYSEPFADSSQIPTYLVSALASKNVTVVLTGDGGDELFCGYNRYKFSQKYWPIIQNTPLPIRKFLSKNLLSFYRIAQSQIFSLGLHNKFEFDVFDNKFNKFLKGMHSENICDLYNNLLSHNECINELVIGINSKTHHMSSNFESINLYNPAQLMMYLDLMDYLPNDILTKVDRAAMAVSLETRLPFLNHEIFKFAWSLPFEYKYRNGQSKYVLKNVLKRYVPENFYSSNKVGFTAPLDKWLRGPLKEWASSLLNENRLKREGYLNSAKVSYIWDQHLNHGKNYSQKLWGILSFQSWLEVNK